MSITRPPSSMPVPLNIAGSSTFGVYPKISIEKTINMYLSDGWLVDYVGYLSVVSDLADKGRAIFTSVNLGKMIVVVDENVYQLNIIYDPSTGQPYQFNPVVIGTLLTFNSDVTFAENNAGQVAICDGSALYIYNPATTPSFTTLTSAALGFIPLYVDFHDTRFLAAAAQDTFFSPPANNTWRLSDSNDGLTWPADDGHIGPLETKPDRVVAVIRFPSRGNMIFVMGRTVTESWFDVGGQIFPYQRNNSYNIDYGCVSAATIASTDTLVIWLAQNEKSGPFIVASDGGFPKRISTDGIDNVLGTLTFPERSEAFVFRIDGHIFYHINFYDPQDNVSFFYDFTTEKFYHATDENLNYFIVRQVAFFNNQYYCVSRNNGNVYAIDTQYTTYDGLEIPRIRVCKNVRGTNQEYFIANDLGFTIEQGTTEPIYHNLGPCNLITEDGNLLITEGQSVFFITQDGEFLITQDDNHLINEEVDPEVFDYLVTEQDCYSDPIYPRVDLAISTDGGESFGNYVSYNMNPLGKRRNMLRFWRLGVANDFVTKFRFVGLGKFMATDGEVNIRK